jgi:hypothetical protein
LHSEDSKPLPNSTNFWFTHNRGWRNWSWQHDDSKTADPTLYTIRKKVNSQKPSHIANWGILKLRKKKWKANQEQDDFLRRTLRWSNDSKTSKFHQLNSFEIRRILLSTATKIKNRHNHFTKKNKIGIQHINLKFIRR